MTIPLPLLLALAMMVLSTAAQAQDPRTLQLYTFHAPPYQINGGKAAQAPQGAFGTTVETVQCVAERMGWKTRIQAVPQRRAIHGLQNHSIDGYFAVDESDLLNRYAMATAPVALEKWYFYSIQPIDDFTDVRIATVAGSNEAIWLRHSRYPTTMTVTHPRQLLALLERDRVDAVLMDERVMSLQREQGQNLSLLHSRFVRFAPLSLYVTVPFAERHPTFLNDFNHHISECMNGGFDLNPRELATLGNTARTLINELISTYQLPKQLPVANAGESTAEQQELDRKWRELAPGRASEKAAEILSTPLSGKLAQWQYEKGDMITEILLMDSTGANVAISVLTSDYWQGDESKFTEIQHRSSDTLYLGPVRFDPSAKAFQVFASMPINDPETGRFLGGIALGLDIEKALQSPYVRP